MSTAHTQVRDADSQDWNFDEAEYQLKLSVAHGTLFFRQPTTGVTFVKGTQACETCREYVLKVRAIEFCVFLVCFCLVGVCASMNTCTRVQAHMHSNSQV